MAPDDVEPAAAGDRELIEEIVRLLLEGVPPGWTQLRGEFAPSARPAIATATVATARGQQSVPVQPSVLGAVVEHRRRADAAGAPWSRLIIDCSADGQLSARVVTKRSLEEHRAQLIAKPASARWVRRAAAALTGCLLIAAAAIFTTGLHAPLAPRAAMLPVPAPPARQQEAFNIVNKWFDAENHSDTATLRRMVCANPAPLLAGLITTYEHLGNVQRLAVADAVSEFHDDGRTVSIQILGRVRPLSDFAKQRKAQSTKLPEFDFVLIDEGGQLKVCDESGIAHR